MRIAVNAIFLQKELLEGYGHYAKEVLSRLVQQHPEHEFIFLFDRPYDPSFVFGPNVKPLVVGPAARHAAAFKYWYDVKAPLALRAFKPDVWIQPYGFCSLTTGIPQLLLVHDLAFLHHPDHIAWHHRWYYKMYTRRFLKKAKRVITVSEYSKTDIIQHYPLAEQKITVIPGAAKTIFQPADWQQKQAVKEKYTAGTEYFICTGGIHPRKNLMNLLKAFSLFKKWQHSNMKLVVAGRLAWQYNDIIEKLKTYKYRSDVILTGYLPDEELAKLTASAYAMVYPSFFEGFGLPIVEAMQSGVPVITSNTSSMPEVGGDAALYANPNDPNAIAKHMLALYRDETFRNKLVETGFEQAKRFNWDQAASLIWDEAKRVVSGKF
jgi:glycosyltransferase involved in cell wall biosynthesis